MEEPRQLRFQDLIGLCMLVFWIFLSLSLPHLLQKVDPRFAFISMVIASVTMFIGIILFCLWMLRRYEHVRKTKGMICPECGYSLEGIGQGGNCPECGCEFTIEKVQAFWRRVMKGGG